jgi:hypothetical protein
MSTPASLVNVSGYTEPGSIVYVNGILVKVMPDGTFQMFCPVNGKGKTAIRVTSMDMAQNTRTIEDFLSYEPVSVAQEKASGMGQMLLIIAIILLVLVAIVAYALIVRSGREPPEEIDDGTVLLVEVESPRAESPRTEAPRTQTPQRPVVQGATDAKRPTPAPVHRPVHPQPRRTVVPQRKTGPAQPPGGANKPLSDKEADQDMVTEENDQGGM